MMYINQLKSLAVVFLHLNRNGQDYSGKEVFEMKMIINANLPLQKLFYLVRGIINRVSAKIITAETPLSKQIA